MYILAIETTGAFASVALAKAGTAGESRFEILAKVQGQDRFSHLQNLTPQIEYVLREAFGDGREEAKGQSLINNVNLIAVSQGPGSFTGIRIGISTARALSQVTGIPCVAVPTLEALAMRAGQKAKISNEEACERESGDEDMKIICPILDARRSQVYGGAYALAEGFPKELVKAGAYGLEEFMDLLVDAMSKRDLSVEFLGDGVDAYGEKVKELFAEKKGSAASLSFAAAEERYQDSETVTRLAAKMYAEGKQLAFTELQPEYMRLAEAERKLKEKQAAEK